MKLEDVGQYVHIWARFRPKQEKTLKEQMVPYIGEVLELYKGWYIEREEGQSSCYAGQWLWLVVSSNRKISQLWVPQEDIGEWCPTPDTPEEVMEELPF